MRLRAYLPSLAALAILVCIAIVVGRGYSGGVLSADWIDREVRGQGGSGELLFVVVGAFATALAVPRSVVSFLGGYAFGFVQGAALALLAETIGCAIAFVCARGFARRAVRERMGARVRRLDAFLAANPFSMTLLVRLLPVGNNFATNLAAGVSRVGALPFLLGTLAGYAPKTVVWALAGSGVEAGASLRVAIAALVLVGSGAIGVWLYRRYRHGRSLGVEVEKTL
ncbi:MAG: TVP38/TMEM64 family protein [Burkholderiales bacterium]|nr:TVP38/TMEM64 family protein [Burkholderiales bacterium]